jgi:ATP-dependent Clp protease adaptor protein ClpS
VKEKEKVEEKVISKDKDEDKQEAYSPNKGGWAVRLFNDPMNKREFVAMCLSKIAGLTDGQAYSVMMQAHQQGVAIVGRYDLERAELYRNSFNENGLSCDMIPVEED